MREAALIVAALLLGSCDLVGPPHIKACMDPNNMPFSNRAGQGLENKLAALIALDLHRKLDVVWWAQRRGYVRNTLNERTCDFWPGMGSNVETAATTRPYYRSTYVFVTRQHRNLSGLTLDDPRLRKLSIGVQMVGDDGANTPPSQALSRRGMISNVRGYMVYGDYAKANPPAEIVRAVATGEIDVALVWGPLGGYFAARSPVPLRVEPVQPWLDSMETPMQFDVSVGVRKGDEQLLKRIDHVLATRQPDIRKLLQAYHVPLIDNP